MNKKILLVSLISTIIIGLVIVLVQVQISTLHGELNSTESEKGHNIMEEIIPEQVSYRFEPQSKTMKECDFSKSFCSSVRSIKFDPSGSQVVELLMDLLFIFGRSVSFGEGEFFSPAGTAVDSNDRIIVADTGNNRIQVFDSTGTFQFAFGTFNGGGQLAYPEDVAVDKNDRIIVADTFNNHIQIFG